MSLRLQCSLRMEYKYRLPRPLIHYIHIVPNSDLPHPRIIKKKTPQITRFTYFFLQEVSPNSPSQVWSMVNLPPICLNVVWISIDIFLPTEIRTIKIGNNLRVRQREGFSRNRCLQEWKFSLKRNSKYLIR